MIKSAFLLIVAVILIVILSAPVFVVVSATKIAQGRLSKYLKTVAIGLDQLGGSILYEKEDWTVSSYTYFLAKRNQMQGRYYYFMKFIDTFFGKNHCRNAYIWELEKHAEEIETLKKGEG